MRPALIALLALTGCRTASAVIAPTPVHVVPVVVAPPPPPPVARPPRPPRPPAPKPCPLPVLYFAFDSAALTEEALDQLAVFAGCAAGALTLSGHADERGTEEYNLALSQARSQAVARHLHALGVRWPLVVVGYGESRPAALGGGEGAWAKNRRVEMSHP